MIGKQLTKTGSYVRRIKCDSKIDTISPSRGEDEAW